MSQTPGPWTVQNEDLSDPWNDTAWVTTANGRSIAHGLTPEIARLIAAAPDLLAALDRIIREEGLPRHVVPWAYDALEKAKGIDVGA